VLLGDDVEAGFAGGFPFALPGQFHESLGGIGGATGEDYAALAIRIGDSLLDLTAELLIGEPLLIERTRHGVPLEHGLLVRVSREQVIKNCELSFGQFLRFRHDSTLILTCWLIIGAAISKRSLNMGRQLLHLL
jgi:hypothetical protein